MVILQFNKLIRNKWVWGVFAVTVCAAFCFDDLFRSSGDRGEKAPLETLSVKYDAALEAQCRDVLRLTGVESDRGDRTQELYGSYGAAVAFDEAGVRIPDAELGRYIQSVYRSKFETDAEYQAWLQEKFGMSVARFEGAWRRKFQLDRGEALYNAATAWVSPMESDQVMHDQSDDFMVEVVDFSAIKADQEKAVASLDDKALEAWYEKNVARVTKPDTYTVRYLEFSASNAALISKYKPTEAEVKEYYEKDPQNVYFTTNETGRVAVEGKEFEKVSESISKMLSTQKFTASLDKELRKRCNLANDAFYDDADKNKREKESALVAIAAEYGLTVSEAADVAAVVEPGLVPGLVKSAASIFGGADVKRIRNVAPSMDGNRYAYLKSRYMPTMWLVEVVAEKAGSKTAFADCKDLIVTPALADARQKAYEAAVAEICKGGVAAVRENKSVKIEAAKKVSLSEPAGMPFDMIKQLNPGEMSKLVGDKVYICTDRTSGDAESLATASRNAYMGVLSARPTADVTKWEACNLARLDYVKPGESKSED